MSIPKKIVAVLSAFIIVLKILLLNASAAFAPVAADGIIELLMALLSGAGYSSSELQGKSYSELNDLLGECISDGRISSNTLITDPITGVEKSIVDFLNDPKVKAGQKAASAVANAAFVNWLSELLSKLSNIQDYVKPVLKGNINMYGMGAMSIDPNFRYNNSHGNSYDAHFLCQYIVVDLEKGAYLLVAPRKSYYEFPDGYIMWNMGHGFDFFDNWNVYYTYDGRQKFYGDVRYVDGTKAETCDEYEYPLGETEDGTKVTADMLNPDGTITIDGVTYDPTDYIDLDKFTDTAIDDLIKEINITINNINVAAPDDTKDIIDEIAGDIELDISSSLTDYTVPKAIATVFPFCLPFDFVRGMKLMFEKPKVPVFKAELDLTNICGFNLGKHEIVISFEKWEPAAVICRWFFLLMFSYTLILLTSKIVKGGGA